MELPSNTKIVKIAKRFGGLWGCSNHCDAQVVVLLESSLSLKKINNFFQYKKDLKLPFNEGREAFSYILEIIKENIYEIKKDKRYKIPDDVFEYVSGHFDGDEKKIIFDLINSTKNKRNADNRLFILLINDQTYFGFSMNDIRCH